VGVNWVSLNCPECEKDVYTLRDGVCLACHYTLLGGDRAPDDLLRGEWQATLATNANSSTGS
jgi:hypothetical protein